MARTVFVFACWYSSRVILIVEYDMAIYQPFLTILIYLHSHSTSPDTDVIIYPISKKSIPILISSNPRRVRMSMSNTQESIFNKTVLKPINIHISAVGPACKNVNKFVHHVQPTTNLYSDSQKKLEESNLLASSWKLFTCTMDHLLGKN